MTRAKNSQEKNVSELHLGKFWRKDKNIGICNLEIKKIFMREQAGEENDFRVILLSLSFSKFFNLTR